MRRDSFCFADRREEILLQNKNKIYKWFKIKTKVMSEREQDRINGNLYALFYLKDVDAEKKREMAQTKAAQRDPLTNVYNRVTFEREVIAYMQEPDSRGMLLLLDIDDSFCKFFCMRVIFSLIIGWSTSLATISRL